MIRDAHVVLPTSAFDADLAALTDELGFRVESIFPADAPATAVVSGHGARLRLERRAEGAPLTIHLLTDERTGEVALPGGTTIVFRPFTTSYDLPDGEPSLVITRHDADSGVGRAGMRYRDLVPGCWGGRFIASHITIPVGGTVPDYVHFHKVRFQLIFVKAGWVKVVYEDQGEPFVMHAGDGVLQPPEIRHRVLESSPGLEVIEVGCPAEHETIADWSLQLPNGVGDPAREWDGQRFVRHVAAGATDEPWRVAGWQCRDTGIGDATGGLGGARVARPTEHATADPIRHDTEFALLVVISGVATLETEGSPSTRLGDGDSVAIPAGLGYRLSDPSPDCELLDVTLPAAFEVVA